eukprot:3277873-Pyramimonas_sp.AAC.1
MGRGASSRPRCAVAKGKPCGDFCRRPFWQHEAGLSAGPGFGGRSRDGSGDLFAASASLGRVH